MAIVLVGIAGEFFGSVGNICFSKVGSGFNVVKNKPRPFRTSTPARLIVRTNFSSAIDHWKNTISEPNKADWVDAAANFVQSRHGEPYTISGQNLHNAMYNLHKLAGIAVSVAPTIFAGRMANMVFTPSWDAVNHKVEIAFAPAIGANEKLLVWWTNADRPGSKYRRIRYRNSDVWTNADASPQDLTAEYRTQDGTIHMHWIRIDIRGAMSTPSEDYYSYTWA